MFRSLSSDRLESLADVAAPHAMRPRERLYAQSDPATACFVVLTGTLRFSVKLGRQTATAGLAFVNDIFGLESLRADSRRPETANAGCAAELLEVDAGFLKDLLIDEPQFQFELLNYVTSKLHDKSVHAVQTGHYDAEQRIAAYLIGRSNGRSSRKRRDSRTMSQADLADYLALTPETFCRKISKFRRLGWIAGSGNEYVIKQRDALRDLLDE